MRFLIAWKATSKDSSKDAVPICVQLVRYDFYCIDKEMASQWVWKNLLPLKNVISLTWDIAN